VSLFGGGRGRIFSKNYKPKLIKPDSSGKFFVRLSVVEAQKA
jgi:hypothetical protein